MNAAAKHLERPSNLSEFQEMFEHIYGESNRQGYTETGLILRLMEEIASAMELARKDRRESFRVQLPRIFSWYNAVANRFGIDLQSALWHKYPGVCSYCMRDRDCVCGVEQPVIPDKDAILRRLRRERRGREPKTLREHQLLHAKLYGWQNERVLPIQTAAHLAEEAGEISRAFRRKDFEELTDEMADIASWLFALATRLGLSFEDIVWERYPYECERCNNDKCRCDFGENQEP